MTATLANRTKSLSRMMFIKTSDAYLGLQGIGVSRLAIETERKSEEIMSQLNALPQEGAQRVDSNVEGATVTDDKHAAVDSSIAALSGVHAYVADRPGVAIEAVDLVKDYGEDENVVHALRGVNVRFEQGKFTAIMGPSGSGKSTLMHTLAGLDSASSGNIVFSGSDITTMNDKQLTLMRRNNVGFIFQSFNLLPMFSAEQNIVMPLTLAGRKADKQWMSALISTLGLEGRLTHKPHELSGGQQQRVAIARALITKPAIVFADEPTGNLDSVSSAEVLEFLRRSVREFGQTIIMVTHDAVAASYADRAIVFADGRIVADVEHPSADRMNALLLKERGKVGADSNSLSQQQDDHADQALWR
jgi:putative ABC transport system ATP-binding protein